MYADPKRIRKHRVTLSFDAYEHAVIRSLADYQGEEMAAVLRAMVLREACTALGIPQPVTIQANG
jgi:hypothetical protein